LTKQESSGVSPRESPGFIRGEKVKGDIVHGTMSSYNNRACRCGECSDAQRRYHKEWREARLASREQVDGRWIAPLPDERHGKPGTYSNYGCRCRKCTRAWREQYMLAARKWRQKRRDAA
jgi:hypothetical protein